MERAMRKGWKAGLVVAIAAAPLCVSAQEQQPWFNPNLPTQRRVDALIAQMSLSEKASQMVNQARAIPRLGIPAYNWWSEALHGVARNGTATVFPEPIGLAATFDPVLVKEMGIAIGAEARVKFNQAGGPRDAHGIMGGLDFWSPNINIFRDPRWGRGQETYGEDPFLTGKLGSAFVRGMQGDDPKYYRTIATAKHYAVHSGPEATRHTVDVTVSKHDQMDTYLPAFRELVTEAKVGSVMCVYNRVNGQPGCASDFLLGDQLKNKWGFQGYVVSDCDAIADIQRGHHYTKTYAEAAAISMKLGVDNDCADFRVPTMDSSDYDRYFDAVKQGLVPETVMDDSLRRLFTARIRLGLFDPNAMVAYAQVPDAALMSPQHRATALKLARESMVLLKNNGVLPLQRPKRIAVVGPLADQVDVLLGNYNGTPRNPVTALDGIAKEFPDAQIIFEPGTNFLRAAVIVPSSALSTEGGQPGLKAEYWRGPDFPSNPALTRTDATLNYDFDNSAPVLADAGPISARWTGFVTVPESGRYRIGLIATSAKLWIDGKLVVETEARQRGPKMEDLAFEAGRKYAVKIEQTPARGPVLKFIWTRVIDSPLERAVAAAKSADLVIAVAGISSALEGEEMPVNIPGFSGGDRTSLDMPQEEEELLRAVKATGKKLVLVLMNGSALSVNWAAKNADAILDAWYPGEEGGTAIAQTLSGANNPSGHLPVTFYTGIDQLPPFEDYSMKGRTYRYFTGKPLYPFGHGLSYTRFVYSSLKVAPRLKAGDDLQVDVTVRNIGGRYGDVVPQLYLSFPDAPDMPVRALRGFSRLSLVAGASQTVHFTLSPRDLSCVTQAGDRVVSAGVYKISVGEGQPGTGAPGVQGTFTVEGNTSLPE
jgi:beta-glucosidase